MEKLVQKTVNLNLIGVDGNAFLILGAFTKQAKREGWTQDEIELVTNEAKSGDYDYLIAVIDNHCDPKDE